jgi:hypothetical protein
MYQREAQPHAGAASGACLQVGSRVTFGVHATWRVCSETWIPKAADLSIVLLVGSMPELNQAAVDTFASTRAHTPGVIPFPAVVTVFGGSLLLRLFDGRCPMASPASQRSRHTSVRCIGKVCDRSDNHRQSRAHSIQQHSQQI